MKRRNSRSFSRLVEDNDRADDNSDNSDNSSNSWVSIDNVKPLRAKSARKSIRISSFEDKAAINIKAELLEIAIVEWEFFKLYNKKAITGMFILVFISNILINVDHGSLPGCSV